MTYNRFWRHILFAKLHKGAQFLADIMRPKQKKDDKKSFELQLMSSACSFVLDIFILIFLYNHRVSLESFAQEKKC